MNSSRMWSTERRILPFASHCGEASGTPNAFKFEPMNTFLLRRLLFGSAFLFFAFVGRGAPAAFTFSEEALIRQDLILVALAKSPADLIIRGATVLNVFSLSWESNQDIVIKGKRIAWTGPVGEWKGTC